MTRTTMATIFLTIVAGVGMAEVPSAEDKKTALAQEWTHFTGVWEIVAVKPEGATKNATRLVFKKDGTYAAQNNKGEELWAGTFEIDPTAKPKVWDHRSHDAKKKGDDVLGIYERDGEKLKFACVVGQWKGTKWVGKPRPKSIDLKEADVLLELKRIAPAK